MLPRTLAPTVDKVSKTFPVLLLTGPRQVGKTTLLADRAGKNRRYVSLDDMAERRMAQNDPVLFLQTHKPPVLIDEVQYAPELFPAIKTIVDKSGKNGQFWLTGSQKFHLMRGVSESLAGRVAILDLLGLSEKEKDGQAALQSPFLPTEKWIAKAAERSENFAVDTLFERIWRGSFPRLAAGPETPREVFFNSYLQTYLERDIGDVLRVENRLRYYDFVRTAAARTGQLLNYADLARDADIDGKTAKSWLSALEATGLVRLLEPYHANPTKRIVKTPKLYFLDTGLAAFLTGWDSPESLAAGAMNGAFLETHALIEILKSHWHNGLYPHLYFYRDADGREIDFLLEANMTLYPVEVKKTASPDGNSVKAFSRLEKFRKYATGHGVVLCLREGHVPISKTATAVNIGYL